MTSAEPLPAASPSTQSKLSGTALPPWSWVVIAVISVQVGAAIAKSLFDVAGTSGVVFIRTLLAAVLFNLIWRPALRGHSRKAYGFVLLYGATIALNMLVFYATIVRIPLGIAVAIAFAGPLGIAVLGSRKLVDVVWVVVAAAGIILLSPLTDKTLDPVGVGLAAVTALLWATYIVITKRASSVLDGNTILPLSMLVATVISLPFGIQGASQVLTNPNLILTGLLAGLLSSAIPFWLEFKALSRLSSRVFGLLVSLEPVAAAVAGFILLHEDLSLQKIVGIGLVTIAAAATTRAG
ncbi:MAG: EamA family transporter [Anaerolineae bacterium]